MEGALGGTRGGVRGIRVNGQALWRDVTAAAQGVRRAWAGPGRERDLVVQAAKAALAAWLAWAVSGWWLHAPVAFVAPWVAVVLVESTVYRSIAHGLQQLAAIAAGTVVATAIGLLVHDTVVAMAVVLPLALLLGQWGRLGSQGIYAATGALFVLTNGAVTVTTSAARLGEALFGAVVGIAVNALIRPPLYLRDSEAVLQDATEEAHDILRAVADGLAEDRWDTEEAGVWHERALRLRRLVEQAHSTVEWGRESLRGNLRHRHRGPVPPVGKEYDDAVLVLDYAAVHTAGVTRTVLEAAAEDRPARRPHPDLARHYAEFLYRSARALRAYGQSRFDHKREDELRDAVADLRGTLHDLRRDLARSATGDPDELATYGALLAQAHRLADQLIASGT
ncbi:Aromatic acid exporter family member 1 [Streptomyces sp. 1222.5]|uniref:FUSC family protein n=1 Tax=unclassified Streptomyces TaxID=2593676 RepID=UPI0008941EAD|nr:MULTISPECIES: aromatic acid exporter family protein [unclassified Streptomyces]PKW05722.1 aromatic acid exporter family member 1 [Streptomyces sp. 5112.2]SED30656.1 Aromatic acid exporter family member 1 [Streptomyces sp. 1222.5]